MWKFSWNNHTYSNICWYHVPHTLIQRLLNSMYIPLIYTLVNMKKRAFIYLRTSQINGLRLLHHDTIPYFIQWWFETLLVFWSNTFYTIFLCILSLSNLYPWFWNSLFLNGQLSLPMVRVREHNKTIRLPDFWFIFILNITLQLHLVWFFFTNFLSSGRGHKCPSF